MIVSKVTFDTRCDLGPDFKDKFKAFLQTFLSKQIRSVKQDESISKY
jgi:hypothetical protein